MVSKKSFTLLVDTGAVPIFTVFSIIFEHDCGYSLVGTDHPMDTKRGRVCIYYKEYISLMI